MPDTMAYPISFGDAKRAYPWSVLADFIRIARAQYPPTGMKTTPGAMLRGMFFGDRLAVCCAPVCAYLFQGLAGSGSVGSQPRFGLEMSSHGADGFGTGRDEAL